MNAIISDILVFLVLIPIVVFVFDFWLTFIFSLIKGSIQLPKTVYIDAEKIFKKTQKKKGEKIEVKTSEISENTQ